MNYPGLLNARYQFQLQQIRGNSYEVKKILKRGNVQPFDDLFDYAKPVTFKRISTTDIFGDKIYYPLSFGGNNERETLLFETTPFLFPYGNINVAETEHCFLYSMADDFVFDVYISLNNVNMTAQLLQQFVEGSLTAEMERLS